MRARETRPRASPDWETCVRQVQGMFVRAVQQASGTRLGRPSQSRPPAMSSAPPCKRPTPPMRWVLERLEQKRCPQGLHVMLEELQWMGERSLTYEKLWHAVRTELRAAHPRIRRVAEGIYWFADADIPPGWSLFRDRRMLPCFYRRYPPAIPWDELDLPENLLPPPHKVSQDSPRCPSPLGLRVTRSSGHTSRKPRLREPQPGQTA